MLTTISGVICVLAAAATAAVIGRGLVTKRPFARILDDTFWGLIAIFFSLPENLRFQGLARLALAATLTAGFIWKLKRDSRRDPDQG